MTEFLDDVWQFGLLLAACGGLVACLGGALSLAAYIASMGFGQ